MSITTNSIIDISAEDPKAYRLAFGLFHKAGRDQYGTEWDAMRPKVVKIMTNGRTSSSRDLTIADLERITEALSRRNFSLSDYVVPYSRPLIYDENGQVPFLRPRY